MFNIIRLLGAKGKKKDMRKKTLIYTKKTISSVERGLSSFVFWHNRSYNSRSLIFVSLLLAICYQDGRFRFFVTTKLKKPAIFFITGFRRLIVQQPIIRFFEMPVQRNRRNCFPHPTITAYNQYKLQSHCTQILHSKSK